MTRVFIYEQITAIGLGRDPTSPDHSLATEGRAMLGAITADFAAIPGLQTIRFPEGLPEHDHRPIFRQLAQQADWSLIIAPETDGELERLCREVLAVGGRLLGTNPDGIALTADKWKLAEHWNQLGVPTPRTVAVSRSESVDAVLKQLRFPVVIKPRDGAGSVSTFLATTLAEAISAIECCRVPMIAQEFVEGRAASVAFLIAGEDRVPLPAAFQLTTSTDGFRYSGGSLPIEPELAGRAVAVGLAAVQGVPGLFGYVGVDVVLGASADVAIEINPRLTTSYVGLRAMTAMNLAEVLLRVCGGSKVQLTWNTGRVQFKPNGAVQRGGNSDFWP
jgi:tyramine---L-glutamate ligase